MRKLFLVFILATLAACASTPNGSIAEKLAVQVATMKYVEREQDPATRAERAARVVAVVDQARVWLDTDGVTLADLQAAAIRRLQEKNLEPSDLLLATALVELVATELNTRIGEGVLNPEKKVTINTFLSWVEQAARFYVG